MTLKMLLAVWTITGLGLITSKMVMAEELTMQVREKIVYSRVAERELLLDAYLPNEDKPRPAVLVVHGGAWKSGNRKQLASYATALCKRGFPCFAIDYRLAPKHKFPAQIEDCRAALVWIRKHAKEYNVDPTRIGAIGYSAGGHLVSLLGTTGTVSDGEDTRLQAVAAGGAPTDFRWFPDNGKWAEYWMGGDLTAVTDKFQAASAAAFVDKDDPPMFFFNGDQDELVPVAWTKNCYDALKDAGVKTEMHIVKGAKHIPAARDVEALQKAYEFLARELVAE